MHIYEEFNLTRLLSIYYVVSEVSEYLKGRRLMRLYFFHVYMP